MSNIAIKVIELVKEYDIYAKRMDIALEVLTRRPRHGVFRALDGISFEVPRGQVFGIIGSNGAGKSTLLKVITGVLEASAGRVDVYGRVTAILELGLGFNPEYSGRQNIYLSGLLYGMDKAEIDRKIDAIITFSGLNEFIERPVKTYSSGMHARLAFSIATAVDPDILIIDEALAAGDASFVQKCLRRIRQLCSGGRTVLLVSHGTGLLAQLCQRVMWMEHGQIRMIGPAIQVVQAYDLNAHQSADAKSWIETVDDALDEKPAESAAALPSIDTDLKSLFSDSQDTGKQIFRRGPVFIDNVEMRNGKGERTARLILGEAMTLAVNYRVDGSLPTASLGVAISVNNRHDLSAIGQFFTQSIRPWETRDSYAAAPDRRLPGRTGTLNIRFAHVPFRKGEYLLSIGLLPNEPATWEFYEYRHLYYPFSVDDAGLDVGAAIFLDAKLVHVRDDDAELAQEARPLALPVSTLEAPLAIQAASGVLNHQLRPEGPRTLREEIEQICRVEGGYPDAWPRHSICPACGEGPLRPAFSKYGMSHSRCGTCDLVCVDPYPPDEILGKLYNGDYYTKVRRLFELPLLLESGVGTPFSAPVETLRGIVERATVDRPSGDWLEVGGGLGAFAGLIADMRPGWTVKLNEMNQESLNVARQVFAQKFEVTSLDADALQATGQRFDVISSVAVVEHIPNPLPFLESYAQLLKPGGVLVIVVPHFSPLNTLISKGSSANVVPPYHTSLFSQEALRRLLGRVANFQSTSLEQVGTPAFSLVDLVDFGDCFDISIPTITAPEPRTIQLKPYDKETGEAIAVLTDANKRLGNYFSSRDGQTLLVAFCSAR